MIRKAVWETAARSIIAWQMGASKSAGVATPSWGRAIRQQANMRDRFLLQFSNYSSSAASTRGMHTSTRSLVTGVLVLLALVIGIGYLAGTQKTQSESADMASVIGTTVGFGQSLNKVSLLAPQNEFEVALDQAYSRYVSPDLIASWKVSPTLAVGRKTSSPWPDHIEILSYNTQSDGSYVVKGNVIEVTSDSLKHGTYADKYPITLTFQKIKGTWLITSVETASSTEGR
jgi:hypothetical protein